MIRNKYILITVWNVFVMGVGTTDIPILCSPMYMYNNVHCYTSSIHVCKVHMYMYIVYSCMCGAYMYVWLKTLVHNILVDRSATVGSVDLMDNVTALCSVRCTLYNHCSCRNCNHVFTCILIQTCYLHVHVATSSNCTWLCVSPCLSCICHILVHIYVQCTCVHLHKHCMYMCTCTYTLASVPGLPRSRTRIYLSACGTWIVAQERGRPGLKYHVRVGSG